MSYKSYEIDKESLYSNYQKKLKQSTQYEKIFLHLLKNRSISSNKSKKKSTKSLYSNFQLNYLKMKRLYLKHA